MKKLLGLLAVAGLVTFVAPSLSASAMSLPNAGAAVAVSHDSNAVTEVRWRGHRHWGGHRHRGWHRRHW